MKTSTNLTAARLIAAAKTLSDEVGRLRFSAPVSHIYNPLDYAWAPHELYLQRFGNDRKRVVFIGMNPGPFGMVQCGVPFGEIAAARDWMGIEAPVEKPAPENPKRPVEGFACTRSEVSGRRLWGLFQQRFGDADLGGSTTAPISGAARRTRLIAPQPCRPPSPARRSGSACRSVPSRNSRSTPLTPNRCSHQPLWPSTGGLLQGRAGHGQPS